MKTKILFLLALVMVWVLWPGSGQRYVEINVNEGQNAHDVARMLKEAGLIRSPLPFLAWVKIRRASPRIQYGRYRFSAGRSSFWIVDDLVQGRVEKVKFVIPEGFASWQIAERLDDLKICSGADFKETVKKGQLEGYLFPATYELTYGMSAATIAHKFTSQFDARWTPEMDARAKEIGFDKKQTVTLASIIEREVRAREELPLVSAVYHNRLKKHMRLEADPTVQFALGYWKVLSREDLHSTKSPYNTYENFGLPPGPIANPGWDAIKAALYPAPSNALFFVAMPDGHHSFSETFRDHTNKVLKRKRAHKP